MGFIELSDSEAYRTLEAAALPLARVSDFATGDPERQTRVYGYPAATVQFTDSGVVKLYNVALTTKAIAPELWASVAHETRDPDTSKDIVLSFDRSDDFWCDGPAEVRSDSYPQKLQR